MQGSLPICRIRGTRVRAHWTLLFLPLFFLYEPLLYVRVAPHLVWIGLGAMLCLLVSVLFHEAAHALAARAYGIGVDAITLWPFGGFTQLSSVPATPASDVLISLSGPVCNLAFGALMLGLAAIAAPSIHDWPRTFASWNLFIGAFNLIPGFPMDGGQALRAIFEMRTSRARANLWAGRVGIVAAAGMILLGLPQQNVFLVLVGIWVGASSWRLIQDSRFARHLPRLPETGDFRAWRLPRRELDEEIRRRRAARRSDVETRARIDQILKQISEQGINSLNNEDRTFLEQASRRLRNEEFET